MKTRRPLRCTAMIASTKKACKQSATRGHNLCRVHLAPKPASRRVLSEEECHARFWAKVEKADCWNWLGYVGARGIGYFSYRGEKTPAHRVAYRLLGGELALGIDLVSSCGNRACVNPAHMEKRLRVERMLKK